MSSTKSAIVLIGAPGVGKSTILNGLIGKAIFRSGPNIGGCLTSKLDEYESGNVRVYDMPGIDINDVTETKKVISDINRLLANNISIKVVFVVHPLEGRVSSTDTSVIRIVLNAIKPVNTDDSFSMIVNQLSVKVIEDIRSKPLSERRIRSSYTSQKDTKYWFYIPYMEVLDGKKNGMLMTKELQKFFERIPEIRTVGAKVQRIRIHNFDKILEQEDKMINNRLAVINKESKNLFERTEMMEKASLALLASVTAERSKRENHREKIWKLSKFLTRQAKEQSSLIKSTTNRGIKDLIVDLPNAQKKANDISRHLDTRTKSLDEMLKSEWKNELAGEVDSLKQRLQLNEMNKERRKEKMDQIRDIVVILAPIFLAVIGV